MALDWLLEIGSNSFAFIGFHDLEIFLRPEKLLCSFHGFRMHKRNVEEVARGNLTKRWKDLIEACPTNFSSHWSSFHQFLIRLLKLLMFNDLCALLKPFNRMIWVLRHFLIFLCDHGLKLIDFFMQKSFFDLNITDERPPLHFQSKTQKSRNNHEIPRWLREETPQHTLKCN